MAAASLSSDEHDPSLRTYFLGRLAQLDRERVSYVDTWRFQ